MSKSRIWGAETLKPIAIKFCVSDADRGLITPANFDEDRLRDFGVATVRNVVLSIEIRHRYYNTLAPQRLESLYD